MKSKNILAIVLIAASVILAIISYILLPERVITQFSPGSDDVTTMPKLTAVLLPLALGTAGGVSALLSKDNDKASSKSFIVSGVGILVFIIMLAVNLIFK